MQGLPIFRTKNPIRNNVSEDSQTESIELQEDVILKL